MQRSPLRFSHVVVSQCNACVSQGFSNRDTCSYPQLALGEAKDG